MSADLGIGRFGVVLNKTTDPEEDSRWIASEFGLESLLGTIPFDVRIARADRQCAALADLGYPELLDPFRSLQKALQPFCASKESVL
jgi:CO dehydrogenase nickel-insertion accessory protein CooC1